MTIWQRLAGLASSIGDAGARSTAGGEREVEGGGANSVAFTIAVIALGAKMAKADGVVSPVEVEAFHRVFRTAPEDRRHVDQVFALAQQDVAGFDVYAAQVRSLLHGDQRLLRDVLESLFYIASADRALHPAEDDFLRAVATEFGISESTYRHVRAQFVEDRQEPYDVLGLDPAVDDEALKARYRKLVRENHPDLVAGRGLPAEMVEVANCKLAAINAAYAALAKERGL